MRRVPLEMQHARAECGLACLAMVAGYFDRQCSLTGLRRRFAGHYHGLTLKNIAGYAQALGMTSRGLRAEPEDLRRIKVPAILHWNMDHFVVLVSVKRKGCLIHDPAQGRIFCSWSELGKCFTGVVLELWPGEEATGAQSKQTPGFGAQASDFTLVDLWRMISASRGQIVWVLVLTLALQVMVLVGPWHVQWTVDEALLSGDVHLIGVLCLGFGLLLICRVLTFGLRGLLVMYLGHGVSFQLACQLLARLLRLPLTWFEQRHVGDIISRFGSLQPVRDLLTQGAAAAVVDLLMVLLSLLLMFVYSAALAGLVLAVHGVFMLAHLCFVPRLKRYAMGLVVAQATEQSHLLESIRAIHNVKVYSQEAERLRQWQQLHAHTLGASMSLHRTQLGLATAAMVTGGAELIFIVYLVAHQVLDGAFTLGMLFAFLSYRGQFTERLRGLVDQLVGLRTLQVHLQRLGEIWCETPEAIALDPSESCGPSEPSPLQLCNVRYQHNQASAWVLDGVNLTIAPGEFVAIIGPSGGGKTTLLKLLMGLIMPTEGHIQWGELRLAGDVCAALRSRSGCVLHADAFFSGSIAENITFFAQQDMQRLERCLAAVGMLDVLKQMPMRFNTQVGDIGTGLSSGQMQRLLLARALYRDPQFLFLDEGTANLDPHSAAVIHQLVQQLNCTRIVVTHDLSFAAHADRVLRLDGGGLSEVTLAARTAVVVSAD